MARHTVIVRWEPSGVGVDSFEPEYVQAKGRISFGVLLPDDDEATFQTERVSMAGYLCDVKGSPELIPVFYPEGMLVLEDRRETRKTLTGFIPIPAQDEEITELLAHVLAGHDLREPKTFDLGVEITEHRSSYLGAIVTLRFDGVQPERCSAFFTVDLQTMGHTEYGQHQVSGQMNVHPETYLEETVCNLCRKFYPTIDM